MVTLVRFVQKKNASFPVVVTLSGMVMVARLLQDWNALSPILVTLLGMVTLVTVVFPLPKMGGQPSPTLTTEIAFTTAGMSTAPPAPE